MFFLNRFLEKCRIESMCFNVKCQNTSFQFLEGRNDFGFSFFMFFPLKFLWFKLFVFVFVLLVKVSSLASPNITFSQFLMITANRLLPDMQVFSCLHIMIQTSQPLELSSEFKHEPSEQL